MSFWYKLKFAAALLLLRNTKLRIDGLRFYTEVS